MPKREKKPTPILAKERWFVMLRRKIEGLVPYVGRNEYGEVWLFDSVEDAHETMATHPLAKANGYTVHPWSVTDVIFR